VLTEFDPHNTNLGCDNEATKWRRKALALSVEFAATKGVLTTLEGPVTFEAGDALITGTRGERWPVSAGQFHLLYESSVVDQRAHESGIFKRRQTTVYAKQIPFEFSVITDTASKARLFGKANDWLIQQPNLQLNIVASDIFPDLYES
jgi:PGDYG protein